MNQAIMVDFSHREMDKEPVQETKKVQEESVKPKPVVNSSPKETVQSKPVKAEKVKTFEKKTLQTSQKPREESSKVLQNESSVVKKIIPPLKPSLTPEEIAEKERLEKKEQKRAHFESLLSKAKKNTAADHNRPEKMEEVSGSNIGTSNSIAQKNKNIQGVLGNRKVLKSPVIIDNSQKKGRVVVKICVDSSGKVISSKYTMMGSTTSDTYLIKLAEEGALNYLFSTSSNPKECGNVTIDFQLK